MSKTKYKATRTFRDSESGKRVRAGDTVTTTEARGRELLRNGLVEEVKAAPAPKTTSTTGSKAKPAAETKGATGATADAPAGK